jgi:ATP-dependent DNA ligase
MLRARDGWHAGIPPRRGRALDLPVSPPVEPMLARLTRELPRDGHVYEPKWDGFRCLVFRDGDELLLQSRNLKPLDRYFPEVRDPLLRSLPGRCVVDGELVVPKGDRLDFDALSERIHPAASRVAMLSERDPASFVAFDLLAEDGTDLTGQPFVARRAALEELAPELEPPVHLTPATRDPVEAEEWFERFEGAGLDGVMAKPNEGVYEPGKRTQRKVKHQRTADVVVAGFRWHKDGRGVGSLLLGLHDDEGLLRHIGVASAFTAARRAALVEELEPLRPGDGDRHEHPWAGDDGAIGSPTGPSRWNAGKDTSWEPLRPELVAEVAYEQLQGGRRLRHGARLLRWRHDRDPGSCRFDQLEEPAPWELSRIFGTSGGDPRGA